MKKLVVFVVPALLLALMPAAEAAPACLGQTATIVGTDKDDTLRGTRGKDVIVGRGGEDRIEGFESGDVICGGPERDQITGGPGDDRLSGDEGGDFLSGNEDDDFLAGGTGEDYVVGHGGKDRIEGGSENDTLFGEEGRDTLEGGGGKDFLRGGTGDDSMAGGGGDDLFSGDYVNEGDDGDDLFDGGTGSDFVSFEAARAAVTVDLQRGTARGQGNDRLRSIEGLFGSTFADKLFGDASDNVFHPGAGDDEVDGRGGTDEIVFSSRVVANLTGRTAIGTREGSDTITNVENMTGSYDNDILIGDAADNVIHGGPGGRDNLRGLAGDDRLIGGEKPVDRAGNPIGGETDALFGGPGDDVLDGAWGIDIADYATSATPVVANLATKTVTGEGTDQLLNIEDIGGSGYDDVITGDDGVNDLNGRAGNDRISAGGGDDVVRAGDGDDTIDGGAGIDLIEFGTSTTPVEINLTTGTATGQGSDTITGIENILGSIYIDKMTGDASPNIFDGRSGADVMDGAGGDDLLIARRGADTLHGGDGNDVLDDGLGDDPVFGDAGDDRFITGPENDAFDGGAGIDVADFSLSTRGVQVDLEAGTVFSFGEQCCDTITGVENLFGTLKTDELFGDAADNVFVGGRGVDQLFGRAGNDTLEPNGGDDVVDGGEGVDTISFVNALRPIAADLNAGFATGQGSDVVLAIENILGSVWPDLLRGDDAANRILGGDNGDIIEGLGGDDHLDGEAGFDTIDGGPGTDTCLNGESNLECEAS